MSKKKEKDHAYDDGSYGIKKNLKFSLFALILCFLIALVIWIYATNKENKRLAEEDLPENSCRAITEVEMNSGELL